MDRDHRIRSAEGRRRVGPARVQGPRGCSPRSGAGLRIEDSAPGRCTNVRTPIGSIRAAENPTARSSSSSSPVAQAGGHAVSVPSRPDRLLHRLQGKAARATRSSIATSTSMASSRPMIRRNLGRLRRGPTRDRRIGPSPSPRSGPAIPCLPTHSEDIIEPESPWITVSVRHRPTGNPAVRPVPPGPGGCGSPGDSPR